MTRKTAILLNIFADMNKVESVYWWCRIAWLSVLWTSLFTTNGRRNKI